MAVIAVIFDFDDTLLPDSTSALLREHGIDPEEFWTVRAKKLVEQGYDPPLAYLNLLLQEVGGRLGELRNADLEKLGSRLDATWFPGLPDLFEDLRKQVGEYRDVSIEFYIISGGLQPIMDGSEYVRRYFRAAYGCQLGEDPTTNRIAYVKRCITFTEKTRYLFEINKGVPPEKSRTQPHLVNEYVPEDKRPVPFRNMIYVGDGLTDIPCFSLIEKNGGVAFGVFQSGQESAKQAFQRFLEKTRRVHSLHHPDYRPDAELGSLLRAAVSSVCSQIMIRSGQAI
jgi:phosphoglycolate phosphatase-like HAD superfamily hydrolase